MLGCFGSSSGPSEPAADGACVGLNQADCARASGCHLEFSSDEPCDNICCSSHFDRCDDGAPNCDGHRSGACTGACTQDPSTCSGSFVQGYTDDGCCPAGCVAISQCDGVTSDPSLSQLGVQGCPP